MYYQYTCTWLGMYVQYDRVTYGTRILLEANGICMSHIWRTTGDDRPCGTGDFPKPSLGIRLLGGESSVTVTTLVKHRNAH